MFMLHIYQRPWSPRAEECARLARAERHPYEALVMRTPEDMASLTRVAGGRTPSLPQVFESSGKPDAAMHRVGGLRALRAWLKDYGAYPADDLSGTSILTYGGVETREGVEIPRWDMEHEQVHRMFEEAAAFCSISLETVGMERMRLTRIQALSEALEFLKTELGEAPGDSLPFYLSSALSARFGLNSCGTVLDSTLERAYNLVWVIDDWNEVKVMAYDPFEQEYSILSALPYRGTTGRALII